MSKNTVIVVGAGASHEIGLPLGNDLLKLISSFLGVIKGSEGYRLKDDKIAAAAELAGLSPARIIQASDIIRGGLHLTDSIDQFMYERQSDAHVRTLGKLAIVRSILRSERESIFSRIAPNSGPRPDLGVFEGTWYLPFFRALTNTCPVDELEARFQSTTLVIFNYDRCLEWFLILALERKYSLTQDKAVELLQKLSIHHPYGIVGTLKLTAEDDGVPVGHEPEVEQLLKLSLGIRTFTESFANPEMKRDIGMSISLASRLVFLGFGFHEINMRLLRMTEWDRALRDHLPYYASAYRISASDMQVIEGMIKDSIGRVVDPNLFDGKCIDLFNHFRLSLRFD